MTEAARTLAKEIDEALDVFLHAPADERSKARAEVHRVLWDNKAGIVAALRSPPAGTQDRERVQEIIGTLGTNEPNKFLQWEDGSWRTYYAGFDLTEFALNLLVALSPAPIPERDGMREALLTLIGHAYSDAFGEGMREHTSSHGGKPWSYRKAEYAKALDAALAPPDDSAAVSRSERETP